MQSVQKGFGNSYEVVIKPNVTQANIYVNLSAFATSAFRCAFSVRCLESVGCFDGDDGFLFRCLSIARKLEPDVDAPVAVLQLTLRGMGCCHPIP